MISNKCFLSYFFDQSEILKYIVTNYWQIGNYAKMVKNHFKLNL